MTSCTNNLIVRIKNSQHSSSSRLTFLPQSDSTDHFKAMHDKLIVH